VVFVGLSLSYETGSTRSCNQKTIEVVMYSKSSFWVVLGIFNYFFVLHMLYNVGW